MCLDPVTAIAIASAGLNFVTQKQQADNTAAAAQEANRINMEAYAKQQAQIDANAKDEMSDRAREAMVERGRLRVLSAESGLAGASSQQLERQSLFNEGFDLSRIEGNRKSAKEQSYLDAKAGRAQNQSRINTTRSPSLIGAGLQIAGAYYGAEAEKTRIRTLNSRNHSLDVT
jgi:hypothetical protein